MTKEKLTINKDEYTALYRLAIKFETFVSYKNDKRSVMNQMAGTFLEDCEELLKEYKALRGEL